MSASARPGWRVDLALIAVALVWGATFILVKRALADVSTLLFLTLRFTLAAAALAVIFHKEIRNWDRRAFTGGALAGVCLSAGYVLQTFGLKYTTASKAGFITGFYIPLVPLFSAAVYRKAPHSSEVLGVAIAFAGMALMTVQRGIFDMQRPDVNFGDLLVLGCSVAYAFHILVLGRFSRNSNVALLTVVQIATGALLGAGTCWWAEPARMEWTASVWTALAVTSLLATALAFWVQTWAQQFSSPTRTALIFSMEPVFAWVTSYLVAGEVLSGRGRTGAALILAGILLVEMKPLRGRQHQST